MTFEALTAAPSASDFTPLQEHQEQTPGTFFGTKPVLHLHSADAQLLVSKADLEAHSAFPDLRAPSAASTNGTSAVNGTSADSEDTQLAIPALDVWVTSQYAAPPQPCIVANTDAPPHSNLLIYSVTAQKGVSIPYPDITLHAIQTLPDHNSQQGLYMQLLLNASDFTPDDDLQTLELTLVPASATPIADLFAAVSACADLNPDPQDSDSDAGDGDDGVVPLEAGGLPGAGGWITSDNIHEHVDADGNFTGFGNNLGAGAGTVRPREEEDFEDAEEGGAAGESAAGGEETKWRRTE